MSQLSELYLRFTFDMVGTRVFDHLHWGLFRDVPCSPEHLPQAQQAYAQALLDMVPSGIERVLDVGCGLGGISRMLLERHPSVLAISPRADHVQLLKAQPLPGLSVEHTSLQELQPITPVQLLVFAESLNFFLDQAPSRAEPAVQGWLDLCSPRLVPGGHILAADVLTPELHTALRGSARLELLEDRDVHEQVAYTARALQERLERSAVPYHRLLLDTLSHEDPALARRVEAVLGSLPNLALRELFRGRMVELEQVERRRYRMLLLRLRA